MRRVERDVMLQVVDVQWKDHLYGLDHLKEGIGLRGYGQKNPLVEYKRESFAMFQSMRDRIDEETVKYLWRLRPAAQESGRDPAGTGIRRATPLSYNAPSGTLSAFSKTGTSASKGSSPNPARTGGDDAAVVTIRRDISKGSLQTLQFCDRGVHMVEPEEFRRYLLEVVCLPYDNILKIIKTTL
mgnify:CR=1 FL=1